MPKAGRDLFVSLEDMADMIEELLRRGYRFSDIEDKSHKTITVTFDDGYHNNLLFKELAQHYNIPYLIFIPSYYTKSGHSFPWMEVDGPTYSGMHDFDYYYHFSGREKASDLSARPLDEHRPMNFQELNELLKDGLSEIGCHGYYHQPLSKSYQHRLESERDLGFKVLHENLNITPRYFALANGMYTPLVLNGLLDIFERVMTIDGKPYKPHHRVIHRISLINPQLGGHLIKQIDKNLHPARQLKRSIRVLRRMRAVATVRAIVKGIRT